ncbi:TetR/AcrR family transcriptional regulator [Embleya sp. AB8]|uniref:TetR/AcrR family transcriptional regulator n=1 Tax=Embleya sp. AB8 TaxID=3156304 RepID=UPI003C715CD4
MGSDDEVEPDGRRRRTRRSRAAMSDAAVELLLAHGLAGVTVEAVAERARVTRRTFSRHFAGKEEAILDEFRENTARINDALRARPVAEPPLLAYRRAVADWLTAEYAGAGPRLARHLALFRRVDEEPALFAAYQRIRIEAEAESVRVIAARLGTDPDRDPRPAVIVGAGAGTLVAALRAWARAGDPDPLPALAERFFATLEGALTGTPTDALADPAGTTHSPKVVHHHEPHHP